MYIYQFPKFFRHYRKYLYLSKAVSTTVTVEASIKSLESADFQILLSSIYWNMTKYFPDKYLTANFFFHFLVNVMPLIVCYLNVSRSLHFSCLPDANI